MRNPSDQRLFAVANALHQGYTVDKIWSMTKIDKWFLNRLQTIVEMDRTLSKFQPHSIDADILLRSKQIGFSDRQIGAAIGTSELAVRKIRTEMGITPYVKQIDTGISATFS